MDDHGIWAQVLYPNVAGFGAGKVLAIGDPELMLACVQAYNDFLTDYTSADPKRLIPIMALPFWDMDLTESEIARCVAAGHKGVIMTGEPAHWGMPKLADPHWDRLWAIAQEADLSVNFHIGSGDMSIFDTAYEGAGRHANYAGFGVQFGIGNVRVIANLITGGVCHRFPNLKFVSVESGIGWIPFALDHLDWQWKNCGVPQEHPEYDLLPSEYFVRQMYGCFWFEGPTVKAAIDQLGADWILYESDFPHPTSMAPGPASSAVEPRQYIAETLGDLPEDVLRKILHDNAARLYHVD
jgi:predicted TIM-barrel fold metal-dependent hydrolase